MRQDDGSPAHVAPDDPREWLGLGVLVAAQALLALVAALWARLEFLNAASFLLRFVAFDAVLIGLNVYQYIRMPDNKRTIFLVNIYIVFLFTAMLMATFQYSMATSKAYEISGLIENADHAVGFYWLDFTRKVNTFPYFSGLLQFCYRQVAFAELVLALGLLAFYSKFEDVYVLLTASIIGTTSMLFVTGVLDAKSREAVAAYGLKGVHFPSGVSPIYLAKLEHMRQGVDSTMDLNSVYGLAAFPSVHVASAILLAAATRNLKYFWLPFLLFSVLVVVSAITEGGHNLMDVLFGCAFAILAIALAQSYRRFNVGERLMAWLAPHAPAIGSGQAG